MSKKVFLILYLYGFEELIFLCKKQCKIQWLCIICFASGVNHFNRSSAWIIQNTTTKLGNAWKR